MSERPSPYDLSTVSQIGRTRRRTRRSNRMKPDWASAAIPFFWYIAGSLCFLIGSIWSLMRLGGGR